MMYGTEAEAQLECDLLNKRHAKLQTGRKWVPNTIKAAGWRETVPTTWWQPCEVLLLTHDKSDHGAQAMHARRTCYHAK